MVGWDCMKFYLINFYTGIVVGDFYRFKDGWGFTPHTSARRPSRKAHDTKEQAAKRYSGEHTKIITASDITDALAKARQAKVDYEKSGPCGKCIHYMSSTICSAGAAPAFARKIGSCAKLDTGEAAAKDEDRSDRRMCPQCKTKIVIADGYCPGRCREITLPPINPPAPKPSQTSNFRSVYGTLRQTHTFVVLELSKAAFDEIHTKLANAGYDHAFIRDDNKLKIDMQGIAVAEEKT